MGQIAQATAQAAGILFRSEAADAAAKQLYGVLPVAFDSAFFQRANITLEPLLGYFVEWSKWICLLVSAAWLVYRLVQVLHIPLDELAALLGFDIPVTPVIDLADVKVDGAVVHWTLPEKQKGKRSEMRFDIILNGQVVDSVSFNETAVTISGLQPASFYVVRVCLINQIDFSGKSEPIRFRTKPAASGDFFVDDRDLDDAGATESMPTVKPYRGLKNISPASPTEPPAMLRQNSTGFSARKNFQARKGSVFSGVVTPDHRDARLPDDSTEACDGTETVQQLTERLNGLRREIEEAERLAKEEEEEEQRIKDALVNERDGLKTEAMEKEKASKGLKKEVNLLERQNTSAQNEHTKQKRLLEQKRQERQKFKEDKVKWKQEAEQFAAQTERSRHEKRQYQERMEEEKEKMREKIAEQSAAMKNLEEEIKVQNAEMKKLERATKSSSPVVVAGNPLFHGELTLVQQMQHDAEEERQWQAHKAQILQAYAAASRQLDNSRMIHNQANDYLARLREERRRLQAQEAHAAQVVYANSTTEHSGPPSNSGVGLGRGDSTRSRRGTGVHSSTDSPRLSSYVLSSSSSPFSSVPALAATMGPSQSGVAPNFFNPSNGGLRFAPAPIVDRTLTLREEEREKLTGGAPMSPSVAAELLPADLFSGEIEDRNATDMEDVGPLPGLGGLPGLGPMPLGPLPGLGAASIGTSAHHGLTSSAEDGGLDSNASLDKDRAPVSPISVNSKPASSFASPQASSHNLHLGSSDNTMDADRRSIKSTRSSHGMGGVMPSGSRFSSMFGIKPRTKNVSIDQSSLDGLPLGKAQSISLPRQEGAPLSGLNSAARKRNSSISAVGSHLFGGALPSRIDDQSDPSEIEPSNLQSKRRFFGLSKEKESGGDWPTSFAKPGFGRPGSPRPGSTHSTELPRPSYESNRWGIDAWPSAEGSGARNSPLSFGGGTAWNLPGLPVAGAPSRLFGSRHPSRRPSVQYTASAPPYDIPEDEFSDAFDGDGHRQAILPPIGTKPATSAGKGKEKVNDEDADGGAKSRLNPTAKDFKTFLGSIKLTGTKDKDKTKEKDGATSAPSTASTPFLGPLEDNESPPASRKSRDQRSLDPTESSITGSSRNSVELVRTPSLSIHSDAAAPSMPSPIVGSSSSTSKESFMQKLSRKSSSGKFSLPTFGKRDKAMTSSMLSGSNVDIGEEEAAAAAAIMSPSISSLGTSRSALGDISGGSGEGLGAFGAFGAKDGRSSRDGQRGSGRSWSSMLKVSKAKREQTGAKDENVAEEESAEI